MRRIPLVAPPPHLLRAGAIWITIANWADALADCFGAADIVVGEQVYSADAVRERFTGRERSGSTQAPAWRLSPPIRLAETFLKDLRWYRQGKQGLSIDQIAGRYGNAPFVWQHHDLFQTQGRALADACGVPLVLYVDAPQVWESKKWGVARPGWESLTVRLGDRAPLHTADLIMVVSESVRDAVADLGVPESQIIVTPCTADLDLFGRDQRDATRAELGLDGTFAVGWVGSFRPFHALDLLVDAFAGLARSHAQARLVLVGDGPEAPRVRERMRQEGLGDALVMTGSVPHAEVGPLMSTFDVAVLQAEASEEFHYSPLKLREYFAAGVPVVAAEVGGVPQTVNESGAGWIVPPGDASSIASALEMALGDPATLQAKGARATAYARDELSTSKQVEQVVNALRERGYSISDG